MALMPRFLYGNWTLTDEPRTRIVASNRNRRRRARKPAEPLPARVTRVPAPEAAKPSMFKRAAAFMRRVIGG